MRNRTGHLSNLNLYTQFFIGKNYRISLVTLSVIITDLLSTSFTTVLQNSTVLLIFFSFSIDDVKQALQYLFCDLIKSMTTKSVSLMAMTSSAGYTWMASSALVSRAPLHCSRLKQFTRKLLLSFKMLLTPFGSGSFLSDVG